MKTFDYDKIIKFAEAMDYNLNEYQKYLLKAMCENKMVIVPRQYGRRGIAEILLKYINEVGK